MDQGPTPQEAETINERMVRQMELRRLALPERRRRRGGSSGLVVKERRTICGFCHQSGDHPTPADCLRALER